MRTLVVGFAVFASAGCVSHEPGDLDDAVPVPVYGTAGDVPCEYEALGIVSVVVPVTETADAGFVERALGEVGARAGAHAVIMLAPGEVMPPYDSLPPVAIGTRGSGREMRQRYVSRTVTLSGQAIQCIEKD